MPTSRLGDLRGHVDAGVEGVAEQQRDHDRAPVPVGGHGREHVRQPGRGVVQEARPDVELGVLAADLVGERRDRCRRPRIPASVRHRHQHRRGRPARPDDLVRARCPSARHLVLTCSGASTSGAPTMPAASVPPVGGSMSRKLPVARMSA